MQVSIDESERQAILLALAELSMSRPGWWDMLRNIAIKMDQPIRLEDGTESAQMFELFRGLPAKVLAESLQG